MNDRDKRIVYRIRKAFVANFLLFTMSTIGLGYSVSIGSTVYYNVAEKFFWFHLCIMLLSLLLLRFFPDPDLT